MWIPKGAALIRGLRLFEARCLLEEIQYISKRKKSFTVKYSTYFHVKTKILGDFQVCIGVPLIIK